MTPGAVSRIELRTRLAQLRQVLDSPPGPVLDFTALRAELDANLAEVRALHATPEQREILILLGRLEYRRGNAAEARKLLIDGLALAPDDGVAAEQRARDHYLLAGIALDLKSFQTAAEHFDRAAAQAEGAAAFDADRRLGIRERQAFALHEAQRFAEACDVNLALLRECERLFGAEDERATTVLINTAQNLYALRRLSEAARHLERALRLSRRKPNLEREQDLLYQLAVLAGEQGQHDAARALLVERLARVTQGGSASLQDAARKTLDHFDRNRARLSQPQD